MFRFIFITFTLLIIFPSIAQADMCEHKQVRKIKCQGCHIPADIQMCFIETITITGSRWGFGGFNDIAIFGIPGGGNGGGGGGGDPYNPNDRNNDGKIDCYKSLTNIVDKKITSHWGVSRCINGSCKKHNGMDMRAPTGTKLYSPVTGTIVATYNRAKENTGNSVGNGNYVRINADNGTQVVMIHMEAVLSSIITGGRVLAGQMIGTSNNTGGSYGSHLHITVYKSQNNRSSSNTTDPKLVYGGQECSAP